MASSSYTGNYLLVIDIRSSMLELSPERPSQTVFISGIVRGVFHDSCAVKVIGLARPRRRFGVGA
jgi:hypothetical protein